ncbi:hypothetical protein FQN53_009712 [Emmonsiellopsis sp. PD_33]|nr:hypothetical protein FQN53_009712 [Emmonsiellopsis sp. PD_33]
MATRRPKFDPISPREIQIERVLGYDKDGSDSVNTFLVLIRGEKMVMRTYANDHPVERGESTLFRIEKDAYERLKAHGVCEKGYVPDYYGSIKKADFSDDLRPGPCDVSAIFLEYLPNLRRLDKAAHTEERWMRAEKGIDAIHEARVVRNHGRESSIDQFAFVSTDEARERIVWMDFEYSSIYPEDETLCSDQELEIRMEAEYVKSIRQEVSITDKCKGSPVSTPVYTCRYGHFQFVLKSTEA